MQLDNFIYILLIYVDKPTAPRQLRCVGTGNGTIKMAWDIPDTDGGSPITGYVIEMCGATDTKYRKVSKCLNFVILY